MDASLRILNTETNTDSDFIRLVSEVAGIPAGQAEQALAFCLKYKLVRRNKSGSLSVAQGVFLDRQAILSVASA